MTHLLDTNAIINLMRLRAPLATRVRAQGPDALAVASITLAELWFGAARSTHPIRNRADQDAALAPFHVLPFDATAADRYATTRAHLTKQGTPIGDRDLMIASVALANRLTVVTSTVGEFKRVPGLRVEDWMG